MITVYPKRGIALFFIILAAFILLTLWGTALTPVLAACVNASSVTSTADAGAGSLREQLANTCDGGTVTLDSSLSGMTVTLSTAIEITQTVTLISSDPITITNIASQRLFEVEPAAVVTMTGLRLSRGGINSINGGLILNQGELTLVNALLQEGSSSVGGGIYNDGQLHLVSTYLQRNIATGSGGGLYNAAGGVATLTNSKVYTNGSGINGGGGIYNVGLLKGVDSQINYNLADQGGFAAGVYNTVTGTVSLTNTTISDNNNNGLYNLGQGTLSQVEISANSALTGAGIYNGKNGLLSVMESTVSRNRIAYRGAGIYNLGEMTVTQSAIINNETSDAVGAGIYHETGSLYIENSTVANNAALQTGGGLYLAGPASIQYSTVVSNFSDLEGTGIYIVTGTVVSLSNSIVAGNSNGDCVGTITTHAHNLLESSGTTACSLTNGSNNDQIGVNPALKGRQYNGGNTLNFELDEASPAIDAANSAACPARDQRNASRPVGASCDIGAVEAGLAKLSVTKEGADFAIPNQTVTYTIMAANISNVPIASVVITDLLEGAGSFVDGSVSISPAQPNATVAATASDLPQLVSGLTISANDSVSIQYVISVSASFSDVITNTAYISAVDDWTSTELENQSRQLTKLAQNRFSVGSGEIVEPNGNGNVSFVITRTNSAIDSSVRVRTINATAVAGIDYDSIEPIVSFTANGALTETVQINVIDDDLVEATETLRLELFDPVGGAIVDKDGLITIVD
ncbi:MAG: choice-of-anchor Q domain-containing protein, partial [Chloroflexota bacterium]